MSEQEPGQDESAVRGADRWASHPGGHIGPYVILEVLGKGGMGTVYLARQEEPVRRQVALKVLKRLKATDRGIARFEAERQALALMNHPSIATVYDAGTTDSGLPFFAMEVVDGRPITDYCDDNRLGIGERLGLFLQVCDAVQHAHQRMVIHRDLKPSNVLVTQGGRGVVPKLIDFGIAKSTQEPLVNRDALQTRAGLPVGTPMYMAPEQIQGDQLDARVDVYALGVLLYELLCGAPPFGGEATTEDFQVMMRVLTDDPSRPSVRLAGVPDREAVAARRGLDAGTLRRELARDLDWIVMRAMAKERERRYGSVAELKADVERRLHSLPVSARPPSVPYRVGRFARRNTGVVAGGLLFVAALVVGAALATVGMVRADRERVVAERAEQRASATLEYLRKMLAAADPEEDGRSVRLVDLFTKASRTVGHDLDSQPEVEAAVRKTIGLVLLELGLFEDSWNELERAVELQRDTLGENHPETLHTRNALGRLEYKLGRYGRAAAIHREVYELQRQLLGEEDPVSLWTMYHLAKAYDKLGRWDEAESLYRKNLVVRTRVLGPEHLHTLVTANSLSLFLSVRGKVAEAETSQRTALATLERTVGAAHPDTLRGAANLVAILNHRGQYDEASRLGHATLAGLTEVLGPVHPETLGVRAELAAALRATGRCSEAESIDREVLASREQTLGESHPDSIDSAVAVAADLQCLGRLHEAEEMLAVAVPAARAALPAGHWQAAEYAVRYGGCLLDLGRTKEAERWLVRAYEDLNGLGPGWADEAGRMLAGLYRQTGRDEAAARLSTSTGG